jgi:hypothetical protein
MNIKLNKKIFFVILFVVSVSLIFAENLSSSQLANRRTAIRCAEVAKSFLMEDNFSQAFSQAELGLAYDETISDLWYIKAVVAKLQDNPIAEILEFSQKAFSYADWTHFSEDLGIILYAEMLINTGNNEFAYEVLENRKDIYSRDAEYLRALSCYLLGDVVKARNIIASAVNVFPEDERFPKLFYKSEYYASVFLDKKIDDGALSVAAKLNSKLSLWTKKCNELLFYAHFFEQNQDLAKRMMAQYFSEFALIPESIPTAIEQNILSQENARIKFENFCENGIDEKLFRKIISSFTDEKQKILLVSFLSKFSGIVTYDVNNDFIIDMKVTYDSGRPSFIQQDFDQDEIIDYEITCDFGTPSILYNYKDNLEVSYGTYPYIDSVKIYDDTNYFLVKNVFAWSNIDFVAEKLCMDYNFYFVKPISTEQKINVSSLFSNSYRISSQIVKDDDVYQKRFVLSNGLPIQATYSKNGIPYANAIFEGGHILYRSVDKNNDGFYEVTEFYQFDSFNYKNFISENERIELYSELFGKIDALEGLYISKISIDDNSDEIPECVEEFLLSGNKTSWFDKDGNFSVSYEKIIDAENLDKIIEKSVFVNPISKKNIIVEFENNIPLKLFDETNEYDILQNDTTPIFWMNLIPEDKLSILVYDFFEKNDEQGKVYILEFPEFPNIRVLAIKIGENLFAESFEYEKEPF